MEYHCDNCDMGVTGMACAKCGADLQHDKITVDNKTIQIAKCPNGCGKIKSPQCCGHDMHPHQ